MWSDENFDLAAVCLDEVDQEGARLDPAVLAVVKQSLVDLAALPLALREVCPSQYDGVHPEQYPPPAGVVMRKVRP